MALTILFSPASRKGWLCEQGEPYIAKLVDRVGKRVGQSLLCVCVFSRCISYYNIVDVQYEVRQDET
jgi:hypothetical protein